MNIFKRIKNWSYLKFHVPLYMNDWDDILSDARFRRYLPENLKYIYNGSFTYKFGDLNAEFINNLFNDHILFWLGENSFDSPATIRIYHIDGYKSEGDPESLDVLVEYIREFEKAILSLGPKYNEIQAELDKKGKEEKLDILNTAKESLNKMKNSK